MSHNQCIPLYNGAKTKPHTYLIKGVKVIRLSRDIYATRIKQGTHRPPNQLYIGALQVSLVKDRKGEQKGM